MIYLDLDTAVGGAAGVGVVGGDRLRLAIAAGADTRLLDAAAGQVIRHRQRAPLRQLLVVRIAAGRIGMAVHVDIGLVILRQRLRHLIQRPLELRLHRGRIIGEGDARRDIEHQIVAGGDLPEARGSGPGFRRPVVVVSSDAFNASQIRTVIVVVLTSAGWYVGENGWPS